MSPWLIVLAIGVGTFIARFSFIGTLGRFEVPAWVPAALRFVPAAVLAPLALPAVVYLNGELALSPSNERLVAAVAAVVVAWWTKNALATIGVGLVALWLLQAA